jgi:anti-sigma factor RsiW
MNCKEACLLLDAHLDGELDLVRHVEIEAHLADCPECRRLAEAAVARREALRGLLPRFEAPPHLASRIRASLGQEAPTAARVAARRPGAWSGWNLAALAASLALAAAGGYGWGRSAARGGALLNEAISDHVRSLQAGHLADVVSTDQHTVKPWFIGKLDFSPPVSDLADLGFPLVGGRLEHLDGRSAAALVFRRRQHPINLFVWPQGGSPAASRQAKEDGYSARMWSQGGLNFAAVSEIPGDELDQFADAYRERTR